MAISGLRDQDCRTQSLRGRGSGRHAMLVSVSAENEKRGIICERNWNEGRKQSQCINIRRNEASRVGDT